MTSRTAACFIALAMVGSGLCGSYFQLVKDLGNWATGQSGSPQARPIIHEAFFQCERGVQCTNVMQRNESEQYNAVYGEVSNDEMEKMLAIWKKMAFNILPEKIAARQLQNLALGKPSTMSSIYAHGGNASLAVDGNNETGFSVCASSAVQIKAWLRVDLLAAAVIRSVRIQSIEAQYRSMEAVDVRVGNFFDNGGIGNPPCQLNSTFPNNSNVMEVACPGEMIARYVTVNTSINTSDIIQICELEVYGFYI